MKYFIGIDNSLSGAAGIIDINGKPVAHYHLEEIEKDEVNEKALIQFLENNGCTEDNSVAALERPLNFSIGMNAARIMWFCYGKLKVALQDNYVTYFPLAVTWQAEMLGVIPKGKSKEYAYNKVNELYGKQFCKTKKQSGGINDAYLIAEWLRREHQRTH